MEQYQTFDYYGFYDVTKLKELVNSEIVDWDYYKSRQNICYEMANTKSFPVIYNHNFFESNDKPFYWPWFSNFEIELKNIEILIKEKIQNDGYILNALFVTLFAKKEIPPHIDYANETLKKVRRIHLPIMTNDQCIFKVGDESINMKEGELWEMNNDKQIHSVHNDGDKDRIHLIIDWMDIKQNPTNNDGV